MTPKNSILENLHKNGMGTTSFDFRMEGMRKTQDFIVYPIQKDHNGETIKIQSDTRIGVINLETGRGLMSKPHSGGAYFMHLQLDTPTPFELRPIDLSALRLFIFSTIGDLVGDNALHVLSDNSNASLVL